MLRILPLLLFPVLAQAQPLRTQHVILVTLDGLRWQELYAGADSLLIRDDRHVDHAEELAERFWSHDPADRRARLMPFFWSVLARDGQLYGNRWLGDWVDVSNGKYFSYPGYNEILAGFGDSRIDSSAKRPSPKVTVLEYVNRQPSFAGRVAAFGSWDVFPYIVNEERSGVPVNAGFEPAEGEDLMDRERFLNELQGQIPSPWGSVRLDAFTHHYAKEYLAKHRPRLLYVAYGETDDFAHDGDYEAYLKSAYQTDAFIRALWEWVQATPGCRDRTTLLVTTDHGRGEREAWTGHGHDVDGAASIWLAAIGPDTPALGERRGESQLHKNQAPGPSRRSCVCPTSRSTRRATPSAVVKRR